MKNLKIKKINLSLLILFSVFCFAGKAEAAVLKLVAPSDKLGLGQEIKVDLIIDTENEQINAVGGKVILSNKIFDITEIRDGNSTVSLWAERPQVGVNGEIIFSGIIPGGFSKSDGLLFSFILKAKEEGADTLSIQEAEAFKNDGLGTKASLAVNNLNISVSAGTEAPAIPKENEDKDPPESFKPEIGRDENVFGGKYFLVFTSQDKNSGIDHYEVKEGFWGKYVVAQSPYLLKDQSLGKNIYIKAVDRASNERVVKFDGGIAWYQHYILLSIIILFIVFVAVFFKRIWPRSID
jgi:hypothetical protein